MRSEFDDVTVVLVTYNSAHCIAAQRDLLSDVAHVVVVDNASNDGSPEAVRQQLAHAQVICNCANEGFGRANNRAFAQATTPYVLMLNPDCTLTQRDLSILLAYAQTHPDVAVLAPQLLQADGRAQLDYQWLRHAWKPRSPAAEGPCCVGFVCGACVLIRTDVLREIGGFDERFFLYYEDEDLFRRLFNAKQQMVLLPGAQALHASRGSVKGKHPWRSEYLRGYHHAMSKFTYTAKWDGPEKAKASVRRVLTGSLLGLPVRLLWPAPKYLARWIGRLHAATKAQWAGLETPS
jgi:N-acetylglucosaminyl-diphospho-decaprenol L-rhamnosyltransferase